MMKFINDLGEGTPRKFKEFIITTNIADVKVSLSISLSIS